MSTEITEQSITTADSNQQPLKTIREGALAASIWSRKSAAGNEYLEFSLSRSWKSKDGDKEGYSQNFFETNEKALVHVVVKACHFIRAWEAELNAARQSHFSTRTQRFPIPSPRPLKDDWGGERARARGLLLQKRKTSTSQAVFWASDDEYVC